MRAIPLGTPQTAPERWERVTDPEHAFTVSVPRGWRHRARVVRAPPMVHSLVVTERPDAALSLFTGDPTLPMFVPPGWMPLPGAVIRPPTSVEHFLPEYAHRRFGALAGLRITAMEPSPRLLEQVVERARGSGLALAWATAGRLDLAFDQGGAEVRVMLLVTTWSFGANWMAEVHGASAAAGDPADLTDALLAMVGSLRTTPAEQARFEQERAASAAAHRATMDLIDRTTAVLRANHQQNLATLHGMAQAHQERMSALWQSHDAANEAWRARQHEPAGRAAGIGSDEAHRAFLNLIAEERTVVDSEGHEHQVAAGFDRYFYRRSDNRWFGLRSHEDPASVPGYDPTAFEEVRVRR